MNFEARRIADQLRRAFAGDPWHGDPLRDLLAGVTVEQACARPIESAHTIWELVLHVDLYAHIALQATQGVPMPRLSLSGKDWLTVENDREPAWIAATAHLFETAELLARAIEGFADERLLDSAPGRDYDFYYLFHGIVQHSLYHGGQIALLKKA